MKIISVRFRVSESWGSYESSGVVLFTSSSRSGSSPSRFHAVLDAADRLLASHDAPLVVHTWGQRCGAWLYVSHFSQDLVARVLFSMLQCFVQVSALCHSLTDTFGRCQTQGRGRVSAWHPLLLYEDFFQMLCWNALPSAVGTPGPSLYGSVQASWVSNLRESEQCGADADQLE